MVRDELRWKVCKDICKVCKVCMLTNFVSLTNVLGTKWTKNLRQALDLKSSELQTLGHQNLGPKKKNEAIWARILHNICIRLHILHILRHRHGHCIDESVKSASACHESVFHFSGHMF